MKIIKKLILSIFITMFCTSVSFSGPFTDDLARCVIVKTTERDKIALVNWIWFAMSVHPDIAKNMGSKVLDKEREIAEKKVAYIVSNLFLDKCKEETENAFKYEGREAIGAFKPLGEMSMKTLMQNKKVGDSLSSYSEFLNPNLLEMMKKYQ